MDNLYRRSLQSFLCLVLVASLTNGLLLVVQMYAWTTMVLERSSELGIEQAIVSAIEGRELCEVCVVVRDETKKQSDASAYQLVDIFVKALNSSDVQSDILPALRVGKIRYGQVHRTTAYGYVVNVLGPPPRLEA